MKIVLVLLPYKPAEQQINRTLPLLLNSPAKTYNGNEVGKQIISQDRIQATEKLISPKIKFKRVLAFTTVCI